MRVMCISHECFGLDTIPFGSDDPQIGDECVVFDICVGRDRGGIECSCYELVGYGPWVYDQRNFATLPDATADEMAEEEQFIYEPFSC